MAHIYILARVQQRYQEVNNEGYRNKVIAVGTKEKLFEIMCEDRLVFLYKIELVSLSISVA